MSGKCKFLFFAAILWSGMLIGRPAAFADETACVISVDGVAVSTAMVPAGATDIDDSATVTCSEPGSHTVTSSCGGSETVTCTSCGNGTVEPGEECDDGNTDNDDGCDSACKLECGNGTKAGSEQCDDGNKANNDGCSSSCVTECPIGQVACPAPLTHVCCGVTCVSAELAGQVDHSDFCPKTDVNAPCYQCPPASANYDDDPGCPKDCKTDCQRPTSRLKGVTPDVYCSFEPETFTVGTCPEDLSTAPAKTCDPPFCVDTKEGPGKDCKLAKDCTRCSKPLDREITDDPCGPCSDCGDGKEEGPEQCDDGNTDGGDGCSAFCLKECGNGITAGPEECDDGNTANGDGCSADCKTEKCGDNVKQGGAPRNEECDDGNNNNGDGCDANCKWECGNRELNGTEECDDGNTANDDGCNGACRKECGDGVPGANETCGEEGILPDCPGGQQCDTYTCKCRQCGDTKIEGTEECDDGNINPADGCDANCKLECGNGTKEGAEQCDGGAPGVPCDDLGSVCNGACLCIPMDVFIAHTGPTPGVAPGGDLDPEFTFTVTAPTAAGEQEVPLLAFVGSIFGEKEAYAGGSGITCMVSGPGGSSATYTEPGSNKITGHQHCDKDATSDSTYTWTASCTLADGSTGPTDSYTGTCFSCPSGQHTDYTACGSTSCFQIESTNPTMGFSCHSCLPREKKYPGCAGSGATAGEQTDSTVCQGGKSDQCGPGASVENPSICDNTVGIFPVNGNIEDDPKTYCCRCSKITNCEAYGSCSTDDFCMGNKLNSITCSASICEYSECEEGTTVSSACTSGGAGASCTPSSS